MFVLSDRSLGYESSGLDGCFDRRRYRWIVGVNLLGFALQQPGDTSQSLQECVCSDRCSAQAKGSKFRAAQVELLKREGNQRVLAELNRVYSSVKALAAEKRLPVACLALPSLHQMSPPQLLEFGNVVKGLIQAGRL